MAAALVSISLRSGLLSLLLEECEKTDSRDLDDLETNTGNITLCLSLSTKPTDQNFVVLVCMDNMRVSSAPSGTNHRLICSPMKLRQPSLGTKAATFFPFLIS